ncbi:hypothetical protein U1839_21075 [Sphingomonas sp. RT2P30]|uniref:hypothetical protein n=1 Tax=Parasphingomonas halimpatiens TaxID=3096162 RepID=UPI002FC61E75
MTKHKIAISGILVFFAASVFALRYTPLGTGSSGVFFLGFLFGIALTVSGLEALRTVRASRSIPVTRPGTAPAMEHSKC